MGRYSVGYSDRDLIKMRGAGVSAQRWEIEFELGRRIHQRWKEQRLKFEAWLVARGYDPADYPEPAKAMGFDQL